MKRHMPLLLLFFVLFLCLPKPLLAATSPTINEFVAHPSSSTEWVEFYNPDHIDMTTYYIDDDTDFTSDVGSSAKKILQNINTSNPTYPYIEMSSMLNNDGDHVVLFDNAGSILDEYTYSDDPGIDNAIGRYPDGTGPFNILMSSTKGNVNSGFLPTPTPSPTDVPAPTPTPKPPTATPTSKPTNTPTPTPKPTAKVPTAIPTLVPLENEGAEDQAVLADAATPTNIPTISSSPTTAVLGASTGSNIKAIIFYSVGGILFFICGILLFRQYYLSKSHESTSDNN